MSWISSIFTSGVAEVVDSVANGIDKLFTTDEERLTLKNELTKALNTFKLELEQKALEHEKEITKRWQSDNESIITKLVRPLSYVFVLVVFALMIFTDGNFNEFTINSAYVPVIETLLATMTVAYFGSRGIEKTTKLFKGDKDNEKM